MFTLAQRAEFKDGVSLSVQNCAERWRGPAGYINALPPHAASHRRKSKEGGPKETAKKKENKKDKDPRALKTDKIEEKNLQENLENVKNKLSPVISRIRPMFIM